MFKRPILIAAMILIMAVRFLYSVDSSLFFPDIPFEPFETLQAEGTVIRHDPHGDQEYLYLSNVRAGNDAEYGKAILIVPADQIQEMELKAGYTVAADCVYRPFEPAPNFGNFDEREYYASEGICFRAKARQVCVTGRNVRIFRQFLNELQDSLMRAVSQAVENEEAAGILTAICLGD